MPMFLFNSKSCGAKTAESGIYKIEDSNQLCSECEKSPTIRRKTITGLCAQWVNENDFKNVMVDPVASFMDEAAFNMEKIVVRDFCGGENELYNQYLDFYYPGRDKKN